jgi:hypothetical protein
MKIARATRAWWACLAICVPGWAQVPAATPAAAAVNAAASAPAAGPPEARVQRTHSEDNHVRVDELRVRGLNRRVVVQSKLPGAPAYEIGTNNDARDSSQDRRSEGRSLWQLLSF